MTRMTRICAFHPVPTCSRALVAACSADQQSASSAKSADNTSGTAAGPGRALVSRTVLR